ncbi:RodZ domain-containing protein [Streptomyces spiramenti]|uniref:Helix-turn-helix domain-containing protein n=1 Tax=Streptomyces spiramenti TaxID=2720606 RepID=A0ABX1ASA1_9ACTN|nr:helix-turn-helix domain-containing protein [Streptomyces spiramenti]
MSNGNFSAEDGPSSVGRSLQQARIAAKLTVEEVSATTRVRIPIVQSIEVDDYSRCGGDVYARGHIRALARAVGLDPAELVARFNENRGDAPAPEPPAPVFEAERIRSEPRRPNWTAAMVAAIVAVVGFVGFTLVSGSGDGSGDQVAQSESPDADSEAVPEDDAVGGDDANGDAADEPAPSQSAVAGAPADKVTMKVVANGPSWVMVTDANGRQLFQGTLQDGDAETFTDDDQLDLVTGNAGAIELYVNGKHLDSIGDPGAVQRLSFTPGDPEEG